MTDDRKYDDIISVQYPFSTGRPRMSPADRASQFAPFAALTGYDALIEETARLTDNRIEMDESMKADLDQAFAELLRHPDSKVSVTYFVQDERKSGGAYITAEGFVKKIDEFSRTIEMEDGTVIQMNDVLHLMKLSS